MSLDTLENILQLEAARKLNSNDSQNVKIKKECNTSNVDDDNNSSSLPKPNPPCPKCDGSCEPGEVQDNNNESTPKKERRYQCPECDFGANFVSTIYTHAAMRHYYSQIANLHSQRFMINNDCCSECPGRSISEVGKYVLHIGGKHKAFSQFLTPKLRSIYDELPKKKTYIGYDLGAGQKPLSCLLCTRQKSFSTITEYKQHLSTRHFQKLIANAYKSMYMKNWKKVTCYLCANEKKYSRTSTLVIHLGAKHNFILDHANVDILKQLKPYDIVKE